VPTLEAVEFQIASLGDEVVEARVLSPGAMARIEAKLQDRLAINARRLARKRPEVAAMVRAFVQGQREAAGVLGGPLRGAMWVVLATGRGLR
jgi:hypothetical protein